MTSSETSVLSQAVSRPFLGLPFEIRHLVYKACLEPWSVTVQHDRTRDCFDMTGPPTTSLLYANRQINTECTQTRKRQFNKQLILRDAKICRKSEFGFQSSLEVVSSLVDDWVLGLTDTIVIEGGTTGMLGLLPWHKMPMLKTVSLEDHFQANPFAVGRVPVAWPFESETDESGKIHMCGVHGWKNWMQTPSCVMEGHVRIVSVKVGFVSGARHRAVVEHKPDCGEFVERVCEDANGACKWIMSQAGSA